MNEKCHPSVFVKEQEITTSTLLIEAKFKRTFPTMTLQRYLLIELLKLPPLDFLIKFKQRLYVEDWVGLELYFENLHDSEIEQQSAAFYILYPDGIQFRPWRLNIPNLKKKGDCCKDNIKEFFKPQVPGTHRLAVKPVHGLQYAGKHGVTGRPLRFHSNDWIETFHIHSVSDNRMFVVASMTLAATVVVLFITLCTLILTLITRK